MASKKARTIIKTSMAIFLVVALIGSMILGLAFSLGGGKSAEELSRDGQKAFQEGKYSEAVNIYMKALDKEPDSAVIYNLMGMAYRFQNQELGKPELAAKELKSFRKAVELNPSNPVYLVNLGTTLYYSGSMEEAVSCLQKALEIYPEHPDRANIEQMIQQAQSMQGS